MQTGKKGLIFGLVLFLLLGGCGVGYYYYSPNPQEEEKVPIQIGKEETGRSIAEKLHAAGVIDSEVAFRIALRLTGKENSLQEGYYELRPHMSLHDAITSLEKGHVKTIKVTIPEGFTIKDIARRLEEEKLGASQDFLQVARTYVPYNYMYGPKPVEYHVEGFLFPATYDVPEKATSQEILQMMTKEMNEKLTPSMRKEIEAQNMTIYEFITLASLVEREALFDADRPKIAAVFKKRLQIDMPLQSCASIEYLLGTRKAVLSLEDIAVESPYNTYKYKGLPPGPIANPGLASMKAVLEAKDTDELFFVADKEGHHHFSKTYEEHLKEIERIYGNDEHS